MTVKSLAGLVGIGAVAMLGACADEEPTTVTTVTPAAAPACEPLPGTYVRVTEMRPVYYGGAFDPGYIAVTDTTAIGSGQPNAIQYVVVTDDDRRLPLVTREQYRVGDQLFVEADTCDRARVTVIQELG